MVDLSAYSQIVRLLGPALESIAAQQFDTKSLVHRHGWIANELLVGWAWGPAEYLTLDEALSTAPLNMDLRRLLNADSVDAFWAELLFLTGLRGRFGAGFAYEELGTSKGRNPDAAIPESKVIFEIAFIDMWQPARDRERLQNKLQQELYRDRLQGLLEVKLNHPVIIPDDDFDILVGRIASWARGSYARNGRASARLPYRESARPDGKVQIEVRWKAASDFAVKCLPPNVFPLTSASTAKAAQTLSAEHGAITAAPEGISVVDHVRKRVRKKVNKQLEAGWSGVVVVISRIDFEPHVTWDVVLEQVLEGDELFSVPFDHEQEVRLARVEDTGVWRGGRNQRLVGAIGVTIDLRGHVLEMVGHARASAELPEKLRELLAVRIGFPGERRPLHRVVCTGLA